MTKQATALVAGFPTTGSHKKFKFAEIERMRTWEGSRTRLSDFLPQSERIIQ